MLKAQTSSSRTKNCNEVVRPTYTGSSTAETTATVTLALRGGFAILSFTARTNIVAPADEFPTEFTAITDFPFSNNTDTVESFDATDNRAVPRSTDIVETRALAVLADGEFSTNCDDDGSATMLAVSTSINVIGTTRANVDSKFSWSEMHVNEILAVPVAT
jgi:hypothetical protein